MRCGDTYAPTEYGVWAANAFIERFKGWQAARRAHPAAPVAKLDQDDLYWRLHSLSKSLEGSGRLDEHDNPDAYATVLDAMNAVRAAAPVALGDAEDAARWRWVASHWKTCSFRFNKRNGALTGFSMTVDATKTGTGADAIEREIDAARSQAKEGA